MALECTYLGILLSCFFYLYICYIRRKRGICTYKGQPLKNPYFFHLDAFSRDIYFAYSKNAAEKLSILRDKYGRIMMISIYKFQIHINKAFKVKGK